MGPQHEQRDSSGQPALVPERDEINMLAFGDGSGYFDKVGGNEIEASGLNRPMRFYVAFQVPKPRLEAGLAMLGAPEYDING